MNKTAQFEKSQLKKITTDLPCLGVVLAGGLSSRMGENKANLMRNNLNMLDYSKQLLSKTGVNDVVVSGNNYDVTDRFSNIGPLGGIVSVIEQCRPQSLLIMPVDLPLLDHRCLSKLKQIGEISQQACYYQDNFLPLYLPVSAFMEQFIQKFIINDMASLNSPRANTSAHNNEHFNKQSNKQSSTQKKGPSMKMLLKSVPSLEIKADNPMQLFNANTQQEWQRARAEFSQNTNNIN